MEKYGNAVVYIEVSDANHTATASGSGFIVSSNGTVVTNFHVIKGCSYASVTLQNGTKYDVKSVLNYSEKQDIAILQLSNATNLSIVNLGDSSKVGTGDNVVAIGSPIGYENTLSTGIISGINRVNTRGTDLQTTASITHGSSGGALFDMNGNVIGITYAGYDSAGDLGFVIPINEVKPFLNNTNEKTLMQVNNIGTTQIAKIEMPSENTTFNTVGVITTGAFHYKVYDQNGNDITNTTLGNNLTFTSSMGSVTGSNGSFTVSLTNLNRTQDNIFTVTITASNGVSANSTITIYAVVNANTYTTYFPLLSDVPQPTNASYYKTSSSSDGKYVTYFYLSSSLSSNYIYDYGTLLTNNSWTYYKSGTDSYGKPYLTYVKGNYLILLGFIGYDVTISGLIH